MNIFPRISHVATATLAAALLLAAPGFDAAAAPPSSPPSTLASSLTGDAKAAYDSGKLLLDDHDYAGAATKFRAAYDASHDARLLWNIAACEKEMRHYAKASVLVDRFLREAPATVDPEQIA